MNLLVRLLNVSAFTLMKNWKIILLAVIIKSKYLIREPFRRNFSSRKEKEIVNVEIENPESSPMISVSRLNLVKYENMFGEQNIRFFME